MREYYTDGVSIHYADEIGFAFMPCIIKASGTGVTSLDLTMTWGDKEYSCTSDAFKAGCIMDYREYIQSFFDGDSRGNIDYILDYEYDNLCKTIQFKVTVHAGASTIPFTFETQYVWGAMQFGEIWGGFKRLTWFRNYPFSFGLYAGAATKILIGYEGAPQKYINITDKGLFNVMAGVFDKDARYSIIYSYDGEIKQATFANIFDLTFYLNSGGAQAKLLRIDFDDSDEGIYLRWIDRHGFYRYWLFSMGDQSREISDEGEFMRNNLFAYSDIVGYMGTFGRNQRYQRADVITLCAPSVDSDTFDMLQDLTSSPVVDMYMGGDAGKGEDKWQSVTVKSGTYTKTGAVLQDFVCQMEINNINIQKL